MAIMERIRSAESGAADDGALGLEALNAVAVTVGDLEAARRTLGALAEDLRWNQGARRGVLAEDLGLAPIAAEAVDVRLLALRKWQDIHDPERIWDRAHLMDAAAICTLVVTDHGVGFDDARFGEVVRFVSELPW